jgi:hypothetical protein
MSLCFFELNKLPQEVGADNMRLLWLKLFKADTEEELEKIQSMGVPVMEQAIKAYRQITADPEFRELERMRETARHNEASALRYARDEGKAETTIEIARKMKSMNEAVEKIHIFTGLPNTFAISFFYKNFPPYVYHPDCPLLTSEQLAEFRPVNYATMEERAQAMKEAGIFDPETS